VESAEDQARRARPGETLNRGGAGHSCRGAGLQACDAIEERACVALASVEATAQQAPVTITEDACAKYTVEFIGRGGRVLNEALAIPARYDITGGEGDVRARIRDSNGQRAWTQPVFVPAK
jgi:hypothetical protein